ncbi:MAG: response regulator [Alphaproteobacteria bacterium]|nr:response regulator [Alphaproteobacteria bacterium]MBV9539842.1 response regulator [Alphaproteobacteria bacterium]MBV9903508.1 response regulator [Alphaproteobacteria bacterium]
MVSNDNDVRARIGTLCGSLGMNITVFETAEAFQESLSSAKPNCAIVDVRLPDRSGLRLQQDLLADGIEVPLIFLKRRRGYTSGCLCDEGRRSQLPIQVV